MGATVGAVVSPAPAVKATDANGNPVSGLNVAWTVTGGGSISQAQTMTNAAGIATAGQWTLGTAAGAQQLVAKAGTHTVTFTANAAAAAPAAITAATTAPATILTGAAITPRPAVVVKDQYGNPVSGAAVTFSVTGGGGAVTGASATTDATGTATVGGWNAGVVPGAQTLRAAVGSLTATFTTTAQLPTGCAIAPYAIGATITGAWASSDCANTTTWAPAGAAFDQYELNLASQQNVRFELTGADGRSLRIRRKGATDYVGLPLGPSFTTVNGSTLVSRHLLGAGDYIVEVQAPASATGSYTLASAIDNSDIVCRPVVQGTIGITFDGALNATTDCPSPVAVGTYEDWVVMPLKTGDRFRITLTTTTMPAGFVLRDDRQGPASPTLAVRSSTTPGTITLDWTATFDTYHEIVIFKNAGAAVPYGTYTLKVERLP